ncbi:bromo adjacent homology domain, zinc finger, RING/FYVE/PHD-type containing protein [Tanacetum coccineum]|uniref:Bromo adjacent homology domain, zinc finger, RING/FYVE/PHD-type containing protein n=1 Tax=Tanacetum coccineum TaxID=301880 RepID=A0ABQ5DRU3_9ASTR
MEESHGIALFGGEITLREHYGGESTNRVASDVADEEVAELGICRGQGVRSWDPGGVFYVMIVREERVVGDSLIASNGTDVFALVRIVKSTAEGVKVRIKSFVQYMQLKTVGPDDYFFRFEYEIGSGWLSPSVIEVFCKCQMPFNPDMFSLMCEACKERYHRDCINMTLDEAKQLADNFTCFECLTPDNQDFASASSAAVDP